MWTHSNKRIGLTPNEVRQPPNSELSHPVKHPASTRSYPPSASLQLASPLLLTMIPRPLSNKIHLRDALYSIILCSLTNIALELTCRLLVFKHLIHLLQRSISRLREKEDREEDEKSVGAKPDVAVFGTPAELGGIDEVGWREGSEPVAGKVESCGHAIIRRAELVVWVLATFQPGCGY